MEKSEKIDKFAAALVKAQNEMAGAKKDSDNPFFKSKYADLTSVWLAVKEALHNNGFCVVQSPISVDGRIGVTTLLMHESGQYVQDEFTLGVKKQNDPQADGSSITYARRYSLAAFTGCCPEDDDANKAAGQGEKKPAKKPTIKPVKKQESVKKQEQQDPKDKKYTILQYNKKFGTFTSKEEAKEWCEENWEKVSDDLTMKELERAQDSFDKIFTTLPD